MSKKNTKRALCMSFVSLLLCCSMLIGSTFAWFTDTASTSVNTIQAGTLKIGLYTDQNCTQSAEGQPLSFTKAGENVLWEPGCTWSLPTVYIKNEGNLALKYKVEITGINGNAELNKVIDWTISDGTTNGFGHLTPGQTAEINISGTMQTTAGNEYQGKTIDGIGIKVRAVQDTVEFDSFSNDYDKNAKHEDDVTEVTNDDTLVAAIDSKEKYTVLDGTYKKIVIADAVDVTINGGKFENQIVAARNGGTVTIKNAAGRTGSSGQAVIANVNSGSTVIFEGGNYPLFNSLLAGDGTGTVVISGGYYDGGCFYWSIGPKPIKNLTITGGKFGPNFMYMAGIMGPSIADFVPDTHQIVNNADGSCTVVAK